MSFLTELYRFLTFGSYQFEIDMIRAQERQREKHQYKLWFDDVNVPKARLKLRLLKTKRRGK